MIKTVNPDATTYVLNGYIYVTTYQQAQGMLTDGLQKTQFSVSDPTFAVYVITGKHSISRLGMKTTTVVLNTNLNTAAGVDIDMPVKSSYVTKIEQSSVRI